MQMLHINNDLYKPLTILGSSKMQILEIALNAKLSEVFLARVSGILQNQVLFSCRVLFTRVVLVSCVLHILHCVQWLL